MTERRPGLVNLAKPFSRLDEYLSRLSFKFWKPIMKRKGIEMVWTESPVERIQLFAEQLIKIREKGEIEKIVFVAGGDDGDLEEFARALMFSGSLLGKDAVHMIRVTKTPMGPAPDEVKEKWVGLELLGIKTPKHLSVGENFLTGEKYSPRDGYAVYAPYAVNKLQEKDPVAAEWFRQNLPKNFSTLLGFGDDEVETVVSI